MERKPQLDALTSLRFFAALGVVLYHFCAQAAPSWPAPLKNLVANGNAGVPFFFMLSGFVLTYTYFGKPMEEGRFWWNRLARVYPAYLLSLIIALPPYLTDLKQSGRLDLLWEDLVTRVFLMQQWAPQDALRWNGPAWSLSCEAFFYLAFPWLLGLMGSLKLRPSPGGGHSRILSGGVVVCSIVIYCWMGELGRASGIELLQFISETPIRHLFLFIAGIALALGFESRLKRSLRPESFATIGLVGSIAAVLAVMAAVPKLDSPVVGLILCAAFGLTISTAAMVSSRGSRLARVLSWAPLVLLGEASYSLYILHEPIGSYLHFAANKLGSSFASTPVWIGSTVLVVLLSIVAFKWFERPANVWLRGLHKQRAARGGASGSAAILEASAPAEV